MTESHYQDGIRLPMIYDVLPFGLWIKIKKTQPPYKQVVLVLLDDSTITQAVYRGEYEPDVHVFRLELTKEDISENVTHWMPLPPAPEVEK